MDNKCLIIVDLQNDFCEGGPCAVNNSIPVIIKISDTLKHFKHIIFTKRCYDKNDKIFNNGTTKMHCIDNTLGSDINFGLIKCNNYVQIKRPYHKSIFCDGVFKKNYKIIHMLKEKKITDIYFCGIDFMAIFNSIIDAYKYGYKCHLVQFDDKIDIDDNIQNKLIFLNNLGVNIVESMESQCLPIKDPIHLLK